MDDRVEDRYTYGHERSNGDGEKELVRHNSFPLSILPIFVSFVCCFNAGCKVLSAIRMPTRQSGGQFDKK